MPSDTPRRPASLAEVRAGDEVAARRPATPTEPRRLAWETRRKMYGPAGHRGVGVAYRRNNTLPQMIRMCLSGELSEGQCCAALSMDRVMFRAACDEYRNVAYKRIARAFRRTPLVCTPAGIRAARAACNAAEAALRELGEWDSE